MANRVSRVVPSNSRRCHRVEGDRWHAFFASICDPYGDMPAASLLRHRTDHSHSSNCDGCRGGPDHCWLRGHIHHTLIAGSLYIGVRAGSAAGTATTQQPSGAPSTRIFASLHGPCYGWPRDRLTGDIPWLIVSRRAIEKKENPKKTSRNPHPTRHLRFRRAGAHLRTPAKKALSPRARCCGVGMSELGSVVVR